MGRPRGFDEAEAVRSAATLFARRGYDGISVDDLVSHLGVHRNSLYKTFGSKRGLYLRALRWHLEHQVAPLLDAIRQAPDAATALHRSLDAQAAGADIGLLLMAVADRAPSDPDVAAEVERALADFDQAITQALTGGSPPPSPQAPAGDRPPPAEALAPALTATVLGLHLRGRVGAPAAEAVAALAGRLDRH
ncbi:TetR/AcrR family transcriptional regulator [Thermomonospora echinospora]|nr:TetR/AcrR family transcriptional regulator [Thermomonospora echinospora]